MYRGVRAERVATRFSVGPTVTIRGDDGGTSVSMVYDSSPLGDDGTNWQTVLNFGRVLDLRFSDFELGIDVTNPQDFEYSLIEVVDSELIAAMSETSLRRPAIPVLRADDLLHFRIAFDDHGTYDIVATALKIDYRKARA